MKHALHAEGINTGSVRNAKVKKEDNVQNANYTRKWSGVIQKGKAVKE